MGPFETVLLAALASLPLYLLTQWEEARLSDPRRLRSFGAAARRDELRVEEGAEVLGYFDGGPIYGAVQYKGIGYRFDRVVPPSYRLQVRARELFVEPGLLYVTD